MKKFFVFAVALVLLPAFVFGGCGKDITPAEIPDNIIIDPTGFVDTPLTAEGVLNKLTLTGADFEMIETTFDGISRVIVVEGNTEEIYDTWLGDFYDYTTTDGEVIARVLPEFTETDGEYAIEFIDFGEWTRDQNPTPFNSDIYSFTHQYNATMEIFDGGVVISVTHTFYCETYSNGAWAVYMHDGTPKTQTYEITWGLILAD